MGILEQVGDDSVAHTKRSRIYIEGHPAGQIVGMACVYLPCSLSV